MELDFRTWIQQTYIPLVLTSSTLEVERIVQKNGALTACNLLNAFTVLENADTPVRTVNHHVTLSEFRFLFQSISQFRKCPMEQSNQLLSQIIRATTPLQSKDAKMHATGVIEDVPPITSLEDVPVLLNSMGPDPLPWYTHFRKELFHTLRNDDAHLLSYPIAIVFMVSSSEANPIQCFQQLELGQGRIGNSIQQPEGFLQGTYDMGSIVKYYVLIHDNQESQHVDPNVIMQRMVTTLSSSCCRVLRINSLPVDQPDRHQYDLWTAHPHINSDIFPEEIPRFASVDSRLGCLLSSEDIAALRSFVWEFGLRNIVPALESRIFSLNEAVSAVKKGVKNVLKSWWRKPKDTVKSQGGSIYPHDSIESQVRLLADTAFLVHDYDLALNTYRLAREDYKSDQASLQFASTNEMIALCLVLTNGTIKQISSAFETAIAAYLKDASLLSSRRATRAYMLAAEVYQVVSKSPGFQDYMDSASTMFISASSCEKGLLTAVLLERGALCDLMAQPSKYRKYGFRIAMAGHVYYTSGLALHSIRCYAHARAVFEGTGWHHVEDHIAFTLARHAYQQRDHEGSIQFFLKLIGTGRQTPAQQKLYLDEFRVVVQDEVMNIMRLRLLDHEKSNDPLTPTATTTMATTSMAATSPDFMESVLLSKEMKGEPYRIPDFTLPEILDDTVKVYAPVNAIDAPEEEEEEKKKEGSEWKDEAGNNEVQSKEALWTALEERMNDELLVQEMVEANKGDWFDQPSETRFRPRKSMSDPLLVSSQQSFVVGESLFIEFKLRNVLACTVNIQSMHVYGKFTVVETNQVYTIPSTLPSCLVRTEPKHVRIEPESECKVRLEIKPHQVGLLDIQGVRWYMMNDIICGEHKFHLKGPLLQKTLEQRALSLRAVNQTLKANIIEAMPWLGVDILQHPNNSVRTSSLEMLDGQMECFQLRLHNRGNASLENLKVICSQSSICIGSGTSTSTSTSMPTSSSTDFKDVRRAWEVSQGAAHFSASEPTLGRSGALIDLNAIQLAPGASIVLPLWLRASYFGNQETKKTTEAMQWFHFLFRYEKKGSTTVPSKSSSSSHRYVHLSLPIKVAPCLALSHTIQASHGVPGEYVLGLTITNNRSDVLCNSVAMELNQLSCVSKDWGLQPFPATQTLLSSSKDMIFRNKYLLGSSEACTLYYRVHPIKVDASSQAATAMVHCSNVPLNASNAPPIQTCHPCPTLELLGREDAQRRCHEVETKYKQNELVARAPMRSIQSVRRDKANHANDASSIHTVKPLVIGPSPTSLEALLQQTDLGLVLSWSTEDATGNRLHGQSHQTSIVVHPNPKASFPHSCPLTLHVAYQPTLSITKRKDGSYAPAQLDVSLLLQSHLAQPQRDDDDAQPFDFTLSIVHPDESMEMANFFRSEESSDANESQVQLPPIFWTGVTRKHVKNYMPGMQTQLRLQASFSKPGVYNLNRFRLAVHTPAAARTSVVVSSVSKENVKKDESLSLPSLSTVYTFPTKYLVSVESNP